MTDNPQSIADRKEHANAIGGPFGIILNPLGDIAVTAGESCDLSITIINDADKTPLVNIFVDETSQPVRDWCVIPEQRLALGVGQSSEITFQFEIPIETASGSYGFVVVIDAPDHYPEDTPILLQQRIQVLPYVQEARLASDPTFTLQPPTRSDQPIPLQQGQPLELAVLVDNRSDRVDRFRLLCPDLDRDWYQIIYEDDFSLGGLIMGEQYLELNPGEQGVIRLIITPPLNTPAGVYTPTVSLKSLNNPDLVLLDVVYLQILPVYLLTAELVTLVGRIRRQNAAFTLFLKNQGNTPRSLQIAVAGADEDTTCRYTVEPEAMDIAPTGSGAIAIEVAPLKRWKRPFYTRVIDFNIRLRDLDGHALPSEVFPGSVVWDGRPWWQFLILVLLAIGAIGTLIFLIWLFFPRPPSPPEILEFSPQSSFYEEENGEAVRLNWQLSNPNRLKTITVQGVSPQGLVISRPVEYDMTQGIPEALADFCQIETILICINVPTDARKPGDYIFKLTAAPIPQRRSGLFGRLLSRIWRTRRSPVSLETNIVRIDATPTPEVLDFSPTQPNYTFSLAPN
ncbi:hypothetical protein PN462_06780, partial [Spirulina sp. CS-785/01]|uniref:COG1470 family protein n=1 Tax=Spirulina sp. CS-785/01 TaxID=3021716 RepID=UPI00232EA3BA